MPFHCPPSATQIPTHQGTSSRKPIPYRLWSSIRRKTLPPRQGPSANIKSRHRGSHNLSGTMKPLNLSSHHQLCAGSMVGVPISFLPRALGKSLAETAHLVLGICRYIWYVCQILIPLAYRLGLHDWSGRASCAVIGYWRFHSCWQLFVTQLARLVTSEERIWFLVE